jgi:YHS domain-containing protein
MKKGITLCLVALFVLFFLGQVAVAAEQKTEGKPQTQCPVMGGKIDKNLYADYQGKRVYFCCEMCKGEFAKDPEKYIKKLEDEGVELEKVPEKS